MTVERWQRMKALFAEAVERPPGERPAFLEAACAGDVSLLETMQRLLAAYDRPSPVDDLAQVWVSPLLQELEPDPGPGARVGVYRIVGEIGRGGMGVVYRGHDPRLGRDVAIKVLPSSLSTRPDAKARFLAEARAASALDHPNICTIYEADATDDGRYFIAMPCYEGQTLRELLEAGPLPIPVCVELALQAAEGLRCAHDAGIVHRDVKPANLMVIPAADTGATGTLKILDFGIARMGRDGSLTQPGTRVGTAAYMAPEQVRGKAVDGRADLWALGVVLYEMLTGHRPFAAQDETVLLHQILHTDPPPVTTLRPDVPPSLEQVVRKTLARTPEHRYPHARALIEALRQVGTGHRPGVRPRALPAPPTKLIGREQEVEAACRRLAHARLLTLTGPGGIGKTRLALDVAARAAETFPGGTFFVDLAPITDPALVASAIAHTLGVPEAPGRAVLDDLKRALAASRVLLVLDNFEQVAAAASVVAELLAACPALAVLVTSRTPLRLSAEQELPVRPLTYPGAGTPATPAELRRCAAVQLFVTRAQALRPGFDLTPENAEAVAALCSRLDGLPLAIELAAARIKLFSPAALLDRLEMRLDLLGDGARDRPSRHRTLQQAIAWSYDLLDERQQRLFRQLSVFAGSFTLEAAEAFFFDDDTVPDIVDGVAALLDQSLLQRKGDEQPRLFMLETIRTFARERLHRAGEASGARHRHALYFLRVAEETEASLTGPDQAAAFERLETEHDNLRTALAFAEAHGHAELGLRLGAALWRFWLVRGYISEGRQWLHRLLALPDGSVARIVRARALNGLATIVQNQGDNAEARALLEESLALWRAEGDSQGLATALNNLGWVACELNDLEAARVFSEEALAHCRALHDHRGMAVALNNLGWIAVYRGTPRTACTLYEESLALRRAAGDRRGIAFALTNLALARRLHGAYEQALTHLQEAQDILETVEDRLLAGWARTIRGEVLYDLGDLDASAAVFEAVVPVGRELGTRSGLAQVLTNLGSVTIDRGDARASRALLEEALLVWRAIGNRWGAAWALCVLARVARTEHDIDAARAYAEESLALRSELGDQRGRAESLEEYALVEIERGRWEAAAAHLQEAQSVRAAAEVPVPPCRQAALERAAGVLRAGA